MAMESGQPRSGASSPLSSLSRVEEVEIVEEIEPVVTSKPKAPATEEFAGGFELVDEATPVARPARAFTDEAPTFAEEPVVFTDSAAEEEENRISPLTPTPRRHEASFGGVEEVEVIELDVESEPALAADGAESLIGALGEDIDSLIDSIIDDIGSSAKGAEPAREPPPTHIPLFSDLTASEFIAVALLLVRREVKVGEVIVREERSRRVDVHRLDRGSAQATIAQDGQQRLASPRCATEISSGRWLSSRRASDRDRHRGEIGGAPPGASREHLSEDLAPGTRTWRRKSPRLRRAGLPLHRASPLGRPIRGGPFEPGRFSARSSCRGRSTEGGHRLFSPRSSAEPLRSRSIFPSAIAISRMSVATTPQQAPM
jgi:hypothetical protein